MVTGCCTLILLQLWSSQSPPAIFLCSDVLLAYLFQQTWGFISYFLCFHADTSCKIFYKSGMCRPSLLLTRCRVSLGVQAVPSCAVPLAAAALGPLPCGFSERKPCPSVFLTSSNLLYFHTEAHSIPRHGISTKMAQ